MEDENRQFSNAQSQKTGIFNEEERQDKIIDFFSNKRRINFYTYPSSESNFIRAIILFFFRSLLIANNAIALILINQRPSIQTTRLVTYQFLQTYAIYLQLFSALLTVWAIGSLVFIKFHKDSQKLADSFLASMLQYVVQLNFHTNGLLMQLNIVQNTILFILSVSFVFYSAVHHQNYIIKSDHMYQSSIHTNLLYYLIITAAYTCNSITIYFQNQALFLLLACLGALVLIFWYLSRGKTLFVSSLSKTFLLMIVSLSTLLGFLAIECYLYEAFDLSMNSISKMLITSLLVFMSLKSLEQRQFQFKMTNIYSQNPSQVIKVQLLARILKGKLSIRQYQVLIIGIIKFYLYQIIHLQKVCINEIKVYDSNSKSHISINKIISQCDIFFKEFIRKQYEASYQKDPSAQLGLKYCEFMLNESPIQSILTQRLEELSLRPLGWFQRYQLNKMKLMVEKKVAKINTNIFEGNLQLQNLIVYQSQFQLIEDKLKKYLFKNISLWNLFLENQLNMSFIKKLFASTFKLIKEMDKGWEILSKYFSINRSWKYLYVNYILYIKNAKIPAKYVEEFRGLTTIDKIFKQEKIYFDKMATTKEIALSKRMLFDSETSVFHACLEHGELFIKRISQYFTKNLKYQPSQIIGANLSIILPHDLRANHMEKVLTWIQAGYQTNQLSYEIKLSHCIDKNGSEVPIFKSFKTFVNYFMHNIEYVCLIKVNRKSSDQICRKRKETIFCESSDDLQQSNIINQLNFPNQSLNLSHQNNIFIKDECFLPVQELKQLKNIKLVVRTYTAILTLIVIILVVLNNNNSNELVLYSSQYINFMQTYRLPMVIANSFYLQILGIGDQTKLRTKIASNVQLLRNIEANKLTLQTLYDGTINKPFVYYPAYEDDVNKNNSYNQIELFHFIISEIVTLANADYIDPNGRDFKLFNDYLKPGYDTLLNKTKMEFHRVFEKDINNMYQSISATVQIQVGVLIFFLLISLYKVINFFKRIKSIVVSISQFKPTDMSIIYNYWCKTFLIFQSLIFKNRCIKSQDIKTYNSMRKDQLGLKPLKSQHLIRQNVNMSRKEKVIQFNKQAIRFKIKIFLLISFTIIFSFIIVMAIQVSFLSKFSQIAQFQSDGFSFLQYYPAATIVAVGCFQQTFAGKYPNASDFQPSLYEDVLSNLWLVGNFQYIGQIKDSSSLYYTKQRIYFFENPCQYNPQVAINAGISLVQCQNIAQSSFNRGLTSFMRLAYTQSSGCIRGTRQMSEKELEEFSKSVTLLSAYILDAIVTWGNEFNTRITLLVAEFFHSNILEVVLIFAIHIFIFELLILRELRKQYKFYRLLYLNMVPQYILIKDKIIKQKFVTNKIIELN